MLKNRKRISAGSGQQNYSVPANVLDESSNYDKLTLA